MNGAATDVRRRRPWWAGRVRGGDGERGGGVETGAAVDEFPQPPGLLTQQPQVVDPGAVLVGVVELVLERPDRGLGDSRPRGGHGTRRWLLRSDRCPRGWRQSHPVPLSPARFSQERQPKPARLAM
nr:hypothetical protein Ade03nite_36750 [Actinoplanes derwentensis]